MIRNLLYNCCPIKETIEVTHDNIMWLCRYPRTFTGRKIVIIRTGNIMEKPSEIIPLFALLGKVEFILLPNDGKIQEVSGFIDALGRLESTREDEATFYAHTKGVSHGFKKKDPRVVISRIAIRQWRNRMYHNCLSDPEKIDKVLKNHATCGCYLLKASRNYVSTIWLFPGSFWWMKHSRLFSSPKWRDVADDVYGTEDYPSRQFDISEAFDLAKDIPLYQPLHYIYAYPFKLFLCNRCKEHSNIHTIPKRIRCPKCGAQERELSAIRDSDMYY